ncbi:MAG: leucine-rich repeat protein [Ruminococcus sp.]|nr:leucine-rich repeat protein [Ruminococcus sp.]
MKKIFALCVSAVMLVFSAPKINVEKVSAVENTYNGGNYTDFSFLGNPIEYNNMIFVQPTYRYTNENGPFMLFVYTGNESDVVVPEYVEGHKVEGIRDYAFSDNKSIKNVTLPDSIYYFGEGIFSGSSVETVNIPKSLKVIPCRTFEGCENLKEVNYHDDIMICDGYAFEDTDYEMPDWLREKGIDYEDENYIIDSSSNFNIRLGDYELRVMPYDFGKTMKAVLIDYPMEAGDVTVPGIVYDIPIIGCEFNFPDERLNTITSITFPPNVKRIKMDFELAKNLKKLDVQGENASLLAVDKLDSPARLRYSAIEEISLNSPETLISDNFYSCEALKKINITGNPAKIEIKDEAFKNCTSLEEINFPENCDVQIYSDSFTNTKLQKLIVNGNLQTGITSFNNCKELNEVTATGDANFGKESFKNCESLRNIGVGGRLTAEWKAFAWCPIDNININTEYDIDGSIFSGCTELKSINSQTIVNSETAEFIPEYREYIIRNFNNAERVGFIDDYIKAQVKKIVAENTTPDMPDIQKVKILHDWVCSNTEYNYEDSHALVQNNSDNGLFFFDSTQCQGYSNAYDLLLREAGIESYTVCNNTHAWNIVKLGGHYFHVDTTWDDSDNISYKWFLKPDREIKKEKNNHSFWNIYKYSNLHSFKQNEVPECKYSLGDVNMDESTNIADLVSLQRHILGQSAIAPDDQILGDLCSDGTLDGFDIVKMRRMLIK